MPEPTRPGPWFAARYRGDCSNCSAPFDKGDTIRSDGEGGWEATCCADTADNGEPTPLRRARFVGTTDEEMGY